MRAAGAVKVGTWKAQKIGTESLYEGYWTCEGFENIRRCSENKLSSWLQDMGQADGKKSRRRAWSSQVQGEAKQTTLGGNPNAPLANSSQSKQTTSPTTSRWSPTYDYQLTDAEAQIYVHTIWVLVPCFLFPVKWSQYSHRCATPGCSPPVSGVAFTRIVWTAHARSSHSTN